DGSSASEGPFLNKGASANARIGERGYEFVFRMTNLPPSATLTTWEVKNSHGWASGDAPELAAAPGQPLAGYQAIAATLPATPRAADIRIGFGFGEWETVFDSGSSGPGSTSPTHHGVMWKLGWSAPLETKDGETVSNWSASRNPDWETRVLAVKNDGSEVTTANRSSANDQTTWRFSGLPVAQVKTFHFQVRRVQWIEFHGIALRPGVVQLEESSAADASTVTVTGVSIVEKDGAVNLAVDYACTQKGDCELSFRTEGVGPGVDAGAENSVFFRAQQGQPTIEQHRMQWPLPADLDSEKRAKLRLQVEDTFLGRPFTLALGKERLVFSTPSGTGRLDAFFSTRRPEKNP
ncbi:MAG: hypothetical protein ABIZ56_02675, partial [Chthoniobacteraceae bacterium]